MEVATKKKWKLLQTLVLPGKQRKPHFSACTNVQLYQLTQHEKHQNEQGNRNATPKEL